MALIQMPKYNNEDFHYKELNDKIAELEDKLQNAEKQLAAVCEERDDETAKCQAAVKAIEKREVYVRSIEEQIKQLHGWARMLQKENTEYKEANEKLAQSLQQYHDNLSRLQKEGELLTSQDDILAKIDELSAFLSEKLADIKEEEKAGFDFVSKKISLMNDTGFQMKILSTMNSVDQNTEKLRNYNDAKCMAEIEKLARKVERVDKHVRDNRYVGALCLFCVGVGVMLAKLFL